MGNYTIKDAELGMHSCALLPFQGRMHPAICDLIRRPIYEGLLRDRQPQPLRLQLAPYPEQPVVLFDTSAHPRSRTEKPPGGRSRLNVYHAELVARLVEEMLESLPDPKPEAIGVVTPYKAQERLIGEQLRLARIARWARVGTVHTFQGLEFVGVIFDTVDAPRIPLSPFTNGPLGSDAMRLINVAITRARDKLVLVAHLDVSPMRYNDLEMITKERKEMSLEEWLERLATFDPDNWGDLDHLRTTFSEEQLLTDLEAEITFRTQAGTVDLVCIRLLDDSDEALVDLKYEILQLDSVVLAEFIQEAAFPPEPKTNSSSE